MGQKSAEKGKKSRETAVFSANPRFLGKKHGKGIRVPPIFPEFFSGTPEPIPETATAFSSFLSLRETQGCGMEEKKPGQERSRKQGRFAQTLEGITFRAAGKSGKTFPAASNLAGKPFQQRSKACKP